MGNWGKEHTVTLSPEREREESSAHISSDTSDDDLLLAGSLDGFAELGVVPSTIEHSQSPTLYPRDHTSGKTHLTSPFLLIKGASGYICKISLGKGPLGPVSADVVMTTGRLNSLPSSEWASTFSRYSVGSQSRPTW